MFSLSSTVILHVAENYSKYRDIAPSNEVKIFKPQNRLFNEEGQVEDDSDNEGSDSVITHKNPYKTPEPHSFLQTAFDLGMMGLEKLKEKPDELDKQGNDRFAHYRRCPIKEHLTVFCRYVCVVGLLHQLHAAKRKS